jgi:hypothetical protein
MTPTIPFLSTAGKSGIVLFESQLQHIFRRVDDSGFVRVWGYLIRRSDERIVTFWVHRQGDDFSFKQLDTYVIPMTFSDIVNEKYDKGYRLISPKHRDYPALLRKLYTAFNKY